MTITAHIGICTYIKQHLAADRKNEQTLEIRVRSGVCLMKYNFPCIAECSNQRLVCALCAIQGPITTAVYQQNAGVI